MGPYCKFCDQRCFVHLTEQMWNIAEVRAAYEQYREHGGHIPDIIATCHAGQAFEKGRIGMCYGDIQALLQKG